MSENLIYDLSDGVATLTLNRPAAMNALNTELKEALRDRLEEVSANPSVRSVVLTGAGRAFCVGQDLGEHAVALEADARATWDTIGDHYNRITLSLATMPKPVIAVVNGIAAGAGASFAFASDFRLAADTAGFNLAFAAIGLTGDSGCTWTLPRLVGQARATELLMLPSTVAAPRAKELGLVTDVTPADRLADAARELATRLARGPTVAFGAIKRSLAASGGHSLVDALAVEEEMQTLAGTTRDHRAAVAAFLAKEEPVFHGR